jgi:hypothetical protein
MMRHALAVVSVAPLVAVIACGARTNLRSPGGEGGVGGESGVTCPTYACDSQSTCRACVDEHLGACAKLTNCGLGDVVCEGELPKVDACRVYAIETVDCMVGCPLETCDQAFFDAGLGPTMPLGLAFNDYICAVCEPCADECSGSPNFALVCDLPD